MAALIGLGVEPKSTKHVRGSTEGGLQNKSFAVRTGQLEEAEAFRC